MTHLITLFLSLYENDLNTFDAQMKPWSHLSMNWYQSQLDKFCVFWEKKTDTDMSLVMDKLYSKIELFCYNREQDFHIIVIIAFTHDLNAFCCLRPISSVHWYPYFMYKSQDDDKDYIFLSLSTYQLSGVVA